MDGVASGLTQKFPSRIEEGSVRHLYPLPDRKVPRRKHVPLGRASHFVDIENLMGGPLLGESAMSAAFSDYCRLGAVAPGDLVVIGANPQLGPLIKKMSPGSRLVVRPGPDGADLALIDALDDIRFIAEQSDRIVIGSGDGIFAGVAEEFRACGLPVGVVSRRRSLAYSLASAVSYVRYLPDRPRLEVVA